MAASQELLCLFSCLINFLFGQGSSTSLHHSYSSNKGMITKRSRKRINKRELVSISYCNLCNIWSFSYLKKKKRTTSKMSCIEMIKKTGGQRNLKNSRMCIVSWLLSWKASFLAEHCVYSPANFLGYWKSNGCFGKYMHRS